MNLPINRRNVAVPAVGAIAAISASVAAMAEDLADRKWEATELEAAIAAEPDDPIIEAINNYRTGAAAYNGAGELTLEEELALAVETYGPPSEVLRNWDRPAVSTEGAAEALRLVLEEGQIVDDEGENLVRAALGYLEQLSLKAQGGRGLANNSRQSPLLSLLREWRDAYDASAAEDEVGPKTSYQWSLLDRARDTPAFTSVDIAAKLLMLTVYGEHCLDQENLTAVLVDAKRFVGVPMPSTLAAWYAERESAA